MQDKDLSEYNPAGSRTSKHLPCSHQLCELGPNCKSRIQPCPYFAQYYSENTSSSGLLVEDVLHLSSSSNKPSNVAVQASVIFGCGKKQSGGYLDGIAPDGLLGLGLGKISVPSLLAKSGLVRDSFSLCFNDDGSGRLFFGDQGLTTHQWTPLLPLDGKYSTYVVGVDAVCVGKTSYPEQTSFHALIDSGTSFTFLPVNVYKKVVQEFDRQVNTSRASYDGYPWDYCYTSSAQEPMNYPSMELVLSVNESFVVQNPIFPVTGEQGILGYCLAIQPAEGNIATIGQNFMTGYRMVFDRENMKLGWSLSDCQDLSRERRLPGTPPTNGKPPNALPTDEESIPGGHAVAPAIAGRAPSRASDASMLHASCWMLLSRLLSSFACFHLLWHLEPEIGLGLI